MTILSLRNLLLASTALSVIAYTAPSIAQSQSTNQADQSQYSQNQSNQNNQANRNSQGMQQRRSANQSDWSFSDQRNFSRIQIVPASDIIGKILGSDDGASGDIEYMLIEPVSGKVMYLLVGMGNMLEFDQKLAVVPFEAVDISKVSNDDIKLTLRAGAAALRNAPSLSDSALNELTSPRMQFIVRDYWAETPDDTGNVDSNTNRRKRSGNRGQDMSSDSSGNQNSNRQTSRMAARAGDMRSGAGEPSSNRSETRDDASSTQDRATNQNMTADQNNRSAGNQPSQTAQGSSSENEALTLVGRTYITALAAPAVMRPDQIRGATVSNREGEEIGSIDSLMIDMERGYVAYALISEGGFLGIGDNFRPVPMQALQWRQGEEFVLPMSTEQLQSMPNLQDNDTPTTVRRSHIERLYNTYQTQPYWQQATARRADEGSANSEGNQQARPDANNRNRNEGSRNRNAN